MDGMMLAVGMSAAQAGSPLALRAELARFRIPTPGEGEVLVKVSVAGLCRTDARAALGQIPLPPGRIVGHEFSGVAVSAGSPADEARWSGVRVACDPRLPCGSCPQCSSGQPGRCRRRGFLGLDRDGAFAEYVSVPSSCLIAVPDGMDDREVAYLEPVAASMAPAHVLSGMGFSGARGVVCGGGRIAELTARVMEASGFRGLSRVLDPILEAPSHPGEFDFAVETDASTEAVWAAISMVRPGGVLVAKSRSRVPTSIPFESLLLSEVSIVPASYAPFPEALSMLSRLDCSGLLGREWPLDGFWDMMEAESGEGSKCFLRISGGSDPCAG